MKINLLIINLKMNISNNVADIIVSNLDFRKFKLEKIEVIVFNKINFTKI